MPDMPILSQSAKDLLGKVRMLVPPMLEKFHKGTQLSPTGESTEGLIRAFRTAG